MDLTDPAQAGQLNDTASPVLDRKAQACNEPAKNQSEEIGELIL
jgi:hypothetical protein